MSLLERRAMMDSHYPNYPWTGSYSSNYLWRGPNRSNYCGLVFGIPRGANKVKIRNAGYFAAGSVKSVWVGSGYDPDSTKTDTSVNLFDPRESIGVLPTGTYSGNTTFDIPHGYEFLWLPTRAYDVSIKFEM